MNKRIISFSLYGTDPVYHTGALRNAALQPLIYPGWTCRFYVSQEIPAGIIEGLEQSGAEIVHMRRLAASDGLFWRFLAAADSEVEVAIVRDADSRLSPREKRAVDAWMQSGRGCHIMRDHPLHTALIAGGAWGCRAALLPDMQDLIDHWGRYEKQGRDQDFLALCVYPRIRGDVLIHTDLVKYAGETVHPFPCKRNGDEFVGAVVSVQDEPSPVGEAMRRQVAHETLAEYPLPPHLRKHPRLAVLAHYLTILAGRSQVES